MDTLRFTLNDEPIELADVSPTMTLLQYVRAEGLTGTKEGCAEGDCGACTVAVIREDPGGGQQYRAQNACLLLLPMLHGKRVYTVEALQQGGDLHPVQTSMINALGSQCGYCTPGFVMSMFAACYRDDVDEDWKIDDQLAGNLCRCTGYRPIFDATREVAGTAPDDRFKAQLSVSVPPPPSLSYRHEEQRFFRPRTFPELFEALAAQPDADIVAGGTDLCLRVTKQFEELSVVVSVEGIDELLRTERTDQHWHLGAAAVLSDVEAATADTLPVLARMLRFFGARQIKNRATVGGNLCSASPIGDLAPVLLSLGADLTLRSASGTRTVRIDEFFTGYRATALQPGEILDSVQIPHPPADARTVAYKVSKRQELDISTVSAGFYVRVDDAGNVEDIRLGFGGMAATPARAQEAEGFLLGGAWTEEQVVAASAALARDFTPMNDHRASAWYRERVAANLLLAFFHETADSNAPSLEYRPVATVQLGGAS